MNAFIKLLEDIATFIIGLAALLGAAFLVDKLLDALGFHTAHPVIVLIISGIVYAVCHRKK